MLYIIDANNLAGKLDLLEEDDFDRILISKLDRYFLGKHIKIDLVFDGGGLMGNVYNYGNFHVIYTPRDNFYTCADDKVLEIARNHLEDENYNGELKVITDDIELREKVQKVIDNNNQGLRVKLEKSTDFAKKILEKENQDLQDSEFAEKEKLNKDDIDDINDELLKAWNK